MLDSKNIFILNLKIKNNKIVDFDVKVSSEEGSFFGNIKIYNGKLEIIDKETKGLLSKECFLYKKIGVYLLEKNYLVRDNFSGNISLGEAPVNEQKISDSQRKRNKNGNRRWYGFHNRKQNS